MEVEEPIEKHLKAGSLRGCGRDWPITYYGFADVLHEPIRGECQTGQTALYAVS